LFWKSGNNADQIIFWSRMPIVVLSIIFGLFIFKWARELTGIIGGLFALTLYAFDPNILGHNHFVTTDLGIAAFISFAFYYFIKFIKHPSWENAVIGGVFLGLVQLAKFSSVIIMPILGLVLIVYPLTKIARLGEETNWKFRFKNLGEYLGKGIFALVISLVLVWIVYFINTYQMPAESLAKTIDFYFSPTDTTNLKNVYTNRVLHALNDNMFLRPMSEYILGIAMVFKRVAGGNGAYFLGQVSSKAFPAYFPTVFVLKEPLAMLFLMILAAGIAFFRETQSLYGKMKLSFREKFSSLVQYFRHHVTILSMLGFVFLYSYLSITGNLNIGFRHLFPILPFIYILVTVAIFGFLKRIQDVHTKKIWVGVISFAVAFLVVRTVAAYPYYMSYFNSIAGGPKNGYHYVTDSNADWGQDMRRLQKWIETYNNRNGQERSTVMPWAAGDGQINKIRVDYFGGADIKHYIGDKYVMWWDSKRPIEPGWYAISTNFLQGSLYDKTKKDEDSYRWINQSGLKPVYQVGTSILIYYVTEESLNH